ncbi:MAG: class B sortase [Clostridia bacterium]|nr:class B sortase [Clostridia bacterium]
MGTGSSAVKNFFLNFFIFFFSAVFIICISLFIMLGPLDSARREYERQELASQISLDLRVFDEEPSSEILTPESDPEPDQYIPFFQGLLYVNEDIRAWLQIPGTKVDYPIMQSGDNEFYLKHNYKKEKSAGGSLFFDCANALDGTDRVLVAYGHNMRDGSMLASLKSYKKEEFYRENRYMYLDTDYAPEKYELLSVFEQNVDPNLGDVFKYNKIDFDNDAEFISHMNELRAKSIYQTDAPQVTADSRILVLQTCTNGTGIYNNDRFVVVGIKVN